MIDTHYLELLSRDYPTIQKASTEIINLRAILNLPKGTEYFFSDIHGEHIAFLHLLKSASGEIHNKIDGLFETSMSLADRNELATLIYYPEYQLRQIKASDDLKFSEWSRITIFRLIEICKVVSSKYTRSKVRKALPSDFEYIINELLYADSTINKEYYYKEIVGSIIEMDMSESFITAMAYLIQRLAIDKLHIIGDIYDRGPRADIIMNNLMNYRDVDIQWGNHDIAWLGAAARNWLCAASVLRLGISYNNFDLLEDGYGINLRALSVFAAEEYKDDPCTQFIPHLLDTNKYDPIDATLAAKMHKAISIIQFKLEGHLIKRHPEYGICDRNYLSNIDFTNGTIEIDGRTHKLLDTSLPTVDPADPLKLSDGETELMKTIVSSFAHSDLLQKHVQFIYSKGSAYKCINSNLLYHGCIPMSEDGEFETVEFEGETLSGKSYLDYVDTMVRKAYFSLRDSEEKNNACDFLWFLWCAPKSPLCGKDKMAVFEKYFIEDPAIRVEKRNPYYSHIEKRESCEKILKEFGLDPRNSHIINGHVPVHVGDGESPIKADGLLFIIDGGLSKAYHEKTGIGGYTFIYNSRYLALAAHKPFQPDEDNYDIDTTIQKVEIFKDRVTVGMTDTGAILTRQIDELTALVAAYKNGSIKEGSLKDVGYLV